MADEIVSRICSKCHEPKLLTEFDRHGAGHRPDCKACRKAQNAAVYRSLSADARTQRRERDRQWRRTHPEVGHAYAHKWEKAHRQERTARKQTPEYREKAFRYYEANREAHAAKNARWRKENRERYNELIRQYRARKRETAEGIVDYNAILERDGSICYLCGETVVPEELEFDHIQPLSRGGVHADGNIGVTHRRCNRRKGTRLPEEL